MKNCLCLCFFSFFFALNKFPTNSLLIIYKPPRYAVGSTARTLDRVFQDSRGKLPRERNTLPDGLFYSSLFHLSTRQYKHTYINQITITFHTSALGMLNGCVRVWVIVVSRELINGP